jgi:hypothetical protein
VWASWAPHARIPLNRILCHYRSLFLVLAISSIQRPDVRAAASYSLICTAYKAMRATSRAASLESLTMPLSSTAKKFDAALIVITVFMMLSAAHAAPPYDDCTYGSHKARSGHCVESPDKNSAGATAVCNDGTLSHSEYPLSGGTCSHHGGVSR